MKKILAFALSIILAGTTLVSCGNAGSESEINDTSSISESSETTTEPTMEEKTTESTTEEPTTEIVTEEKYSNFNKRVEQIEKQYNVFLKDYLDVREKGDLYEYYKLKSPISLTEDGSTIMYNIGDSEEYREYRIVIDAFNEDDISSIVVTDFTGQTPTTLLFMSYAAITGCSEDEFANFVEKLANSKDNIVCNNDELIRHSLYDGEWAWEYDYEIKNNVYSFSVWSGYIYERNASDITINFFRNHN